MTLYFIGLGLFDEKDISVKGLEIIRKCETIYLENYTCALSVPPEKLEDFYGKKIILADREMVENRAEDTILNDAKTANTAFLVIGDPMSATTHTDLFLRAKELGIKTQIIHNASVFTAVGMTGLQLYKFGKTSSIVFPDDNWFPETPYDTIILNKKSGLHTLLLLDIKVKEQSKENMKKNRQEYQHARYMTVNEAIEVMLKIEEKRKENIFTDETIGIGLARLGSEDATIKAGTIKDLRKLDFGKPLHCLIIPGKLHFIEEEAIKNWT